MDEHRTRRVSETLREELAELIGYEMSDPRVVSVVVTEVVIAPDMRRARVRVAVPGGEVEQEAAMEALDQAKGFLRHQLAGRVQMFRVPDLRFELAVQTATVSRINYLRRRIRKGRPRGE